VSENLCDEYVLHHTVFHRWQKAFSQTGTAAFEWQGDGQTRKLEKKVSALQAKLRRRTK